MCSCSGHNIGLHLQFNPEKLVYGYQQRGGGSRLLPPSILLEGINTEKREKIYKKMKLFKCGAIYVSVCRPHKL
jgi:hypothetical protein